MRFCVMVFIGKEILTVLRAMTIHTPEELAKFFKLSRAAEEYSKSVKEMLDELPKKIHGMLSQDWAASIPADKHRVVTRELTLPYGNHWEAIQIIQQKERRLKGCDKIKDKIRNDIMKDYSEIYHLWSNFDIQAPKVLARYMQEKAPMTFQEAIKYVTDNNRWSKCVRFSIVFKPRDATSVTVWHGQEGQEYFLMIEHMDRFWRREDARELTEDELEWEPSLREGEWRVACPHDEARYVEVGPINDYFLGPEGRKQTNSSIIMCKTDMSVGAGSEGQVTEEEAKKVFNAYVCHNIRVANEFRFLEDAHFEKLKESFPGMLGDTSINVLKIMKRLVSQ